MHTVCNTDLADHTTHRTTPVPDPHQPTLRRMCHLQRRFKTPESFLPAGVDTPQPAALGNYQLRVSRACQWPRGISPRRRWRIPGSTTRQSTSRSCPLAAFGRPSVPGICGTHRSAKSRKCAKGSARSRAAGARLRRATTPPSRASGTPWG